MWLVCRHVVCMVARQEPRLWCLHPAIVSASSALASVAYSIHLQILLACRQFMHIVCSLTPAFRSAVSLLLRALFPRAFTKHPTHQPSLLTLLACPLQEAAAIGQGGPSSSGRQQAPAPPTPEPESTGAPQMIVDPETGRLVLDKASLTVQAQPHQEYVRRDEGHHDLVNSQTYLKRGATNKWTPEETDEFWAVSSISGSARH